MRRLSSPLLSGRRRGDDGQQCVRPPPLVTHFGFRSSSIANTVDLQIHLNRSKPENVFLAGGFKCGHR